MNLQNIWRAIVEPPKNAPGDYAERIVYVEAYSAKSATAKIIAIIASIDGVADDEVSFYNLDSWADLVAKGMSSNWDHRIFETGWRGDVVDGWARCPLFLVTNPAPLKALWLAATNPLEDETCA